MDMSIHGFLIDVEFAGMWLVANVEDWRIR